MSTGSRLTVDLAKQFAWLLRKDLRESFASKDDPGFAEWWLIKGRQEFPGWADSLDADQLNALFASAGTATIAGVQLDVPKLASLLAKYRPDAVKEFAKDGKLQNELFFAWVVVRGLAEHQLAQHAPRSLVAALDQPVPDTLAKAGEDDVSAANSVPAATLLMYLLWRLMDDKTQQALNINTPQGRLAYLGWFFNVVGTLGIAPLVAGRWKAWVQSPEGAAALATQKTTAAKLPWLAPNTKQQATAPSTAADKPFGLNIYGFAYGELGIGEDLRMAVECCEAAGIAYHVVNVDAGDARQADLHLKGKVSDGTELPPYNTNLFCLPAFDTVSRVFMQKGAAVFEGYRNIGWWPWELAVFPKAWKPYAFELVDEVWASSTFLEEMYKQATDKPVKLVPLAVSVARMKPYPRKHYGLPEKKFLFLYIFDFNSSVARKNPMAAVQAFKQAFKPTDNTVGLVLKTMNTKPNNPEWQEFLKECQTDQRIKLITETLDRPEVLGLINACDAYVSLHRAEGFGRTLVEATLLGKSVIATNYSGNKDFSKSRNIIPVNYKLIPIFKNYYWVDENDSAEWADADVDDAALQLQNVKSNKIQISAGVVKHTPKEVGERMFSMLKLPINMNWTIRGGLYVYDFYWQVPAKTEKWIAERLNLEGLPFKNIEIICFPWATLIDLIDRGQIVRAEYFLLKLKEIKKGGKKRVTFCQHVNLLNHIKLFSLVEIDILYWSHKTIDINTICGISLKPLPLYPVVNLDDDLSTPSMEKIYDYSFIGAYDPFCYISKIRSDIFKHDFKSRKFIERKKQWHYEEVVYGLQINSIPLAENKLDQMKKDAAVYKDVMMKSLFSLCPSGSGPNSIRLWESLALGVIPILLSDNLDLPSMPKKINIIRWKEEEFSLKIDQPIDYKNIKFNSCVNSNELLDYLVSDLLVIDELSVKG